MIRDYDIEELCIVYLVIKMIPASCEDEYVCESMYDLITGTWYSVKDLNQIINN